MITIEGLKSLGVNTDEGIARCMGMEDFYLNLVKSVLSLDKLKELKAQIEAGDTKAAFETAHALKGMYANLSLDPVAKPVSEITEHLRHGENIDYSAYINEALENMRKLTELL